jgi:predicted transcriptional regulator
MAGTTKRPASSVLDRARRWPDERRREAERLLEAMEHAGTDVYLLSEEERLLVEEGLAESLRGDLVPEEEMEAFFNRHVK